jgi:hypothetical protein
LQVLRGKFNRAYNDILRGMNMLVREMTKVAAVAAAVVGLGGTGPRTELEQHEAEVGEPRLEVEVLLAEVHKRLLPTTLMTVSNLKCERHPGMTSSSHQTVTPRHPLTLHLDLDRGSLHPYRNGARKPQPG